MFRGLPCWSSHLSSRSGYTHTHQCSPGCHCPVTSIQQCEPLLTFSLAMSVIFFILKYAPLAMPKASYPEYGICTHSYPQICQNKFFYLYFDRINHSSLFITGIVLLYSSQESSPASQSLSSKIQTASSVGTFQLQIQLQPQLVEQCEF